MPPESIDPAPPAPTRRPAPQRRWAGLALAAVLVAGALLLTRGRDDNAPGFGVVAQVGPDAQATTLDTGPRAGNLAPNFRLATADGSEILLSDLRGRPVFLNFWATWCFSCLTEMPLLQAQADRYGDDAVVVGVNVGETLETAQIFATNFEIRFPLALDRDTTVAQAYEIRPMPTSFVIDANGMIVAVFPGVVSRAQMDEQLAPLISAVEGP